MQPQRDVVAEDALQPVKRPSDPRSIVGDGMGKDNGVGFRVGQAESAPQGVAKLVVQRHADAAEAGAAQPRPVERGRASLAVVRVAHDCG